MDQLTPEEQQMLQDYLARPEIAEIRAQHDAIVIPFFSEDLKSFRVLVVVDDELLAFPSQKVQEFMNNPPQYGKAPITAFGYFKQVVAGMEVNHPVRRIDHLDLWALYDEEEKEEWERMKSRDQKIMDAMIKLGLAERKNEQ